ncbi:hypothetical protein GXW82_04395 [Streptacidiphilus sp. 4-A2]|nr:hypothetical protein [Streptacidiphilus sp. 4-A2]
MRAHVLAADRAGAAEALERLAARPAGALAGTGLTAPGTEPGALAAEAALWLAGAPAPAAAVPAAAGSTCPPPPRNGARHAVLTLPGSAAPAEENTVDATSITAEPGPADSLEASVTAALVEALGWRGRSTPAPPTSPRAATR